MIDPAIQIMLDTVLRPPPVPAPPDVKQMRAFALESQRLWGGTPEAVPSVRDTIVTGEGGPIRVRIYGAGSSIACPTFVYAHGGGWVAGSIDSHDTLCRRLANRLQAIFVSVDYRLAPEHPFPAALNDFDAAWRWAHAEIASLGGDPSRCAVGGDSSGANLAAALTQRLRARGEPQPAFQLLLYPALDGTCSGASYRAFATGFSLTAKQMKWYWDQYAGAAARNDTGLSPLSARTFEDLPRAVIAVAEADVLHDDGVNYAQQLASSGVPVQLIECGGMIHGFLRWTGTVPASGMWLDTIAAAARF